VCIIFAGHDLMSPTHNALSVSLFNQGAALLTMLALAYISSVGRLMEGVAVSAEPHLLPCQRVLGQCPTAPKASPSGCL
jgi:hypothetical protein